MLEGECLKLKLPPLLCSLLASPVNDQVRLPIEFPTKVKAAGLAGQAELQIEILCTGTW